MGKPSGLKTPTFAWGFSFVRRQKRQPPLPDMRKHVIIKKYVWLLRSLVYASGTVLQFTPPSRGLFLVRKKNSLDTLYLQMNISRQYRWQLKKKAEGLCGQCGKRPLVNKHLCQECHEKRRAYNRFYYARHREERRAYQQKWLQNKTDRVIE